MRLIKKYTNRRLYDTNLSKYITFEDLASYVRDGIEFHVIDAKTNADLTANTLLQILIEIEAGSSPLLSAEMLRQLIIFAKHPFSQSVKDMMAQFLSQLESGLPLNSAMPDFKKSTDAWVKQMHTTMDAWQKLFGITSK